LIKTVYLTVRLLILPILLLAGTFGHPGSAQAAASAWAEGDQARLRLISASDAVGSEGAVTIGLQVQLKPSWKIYWRSPGDAGLPPQLDWSGSSNFGSVEMRWPVPHRFTLFGLDTFGYEGEVVLPLTVRLAMPGEATDLKAKIRYLVCDPQICVPAEAALALDLRSGPAAPAPEAELIQHFVEEVPGDGREDGLRLGSVTVGRVGDHSGLIVEAEAEPPFAKPDLIVEGPASLSFRAPKVTLMEGGRRARFEVPAESQQQNAPGLGGLPLILTLYDGKRALEAAVKPVAANPIGSPMLLAMLGFAFLGGFILNFMPCVLPVLALKLLGVVGQGGRERAAIRASFLASAAGILFSFLVLATALILLKSAGAAVGWGIQFQQPLFLAILTLILVLFAANLFGLFEIPLPSWAGGIAQGSGEPSHGHSIAGAFAAGAFATLLATPCSAPFLGTAVGFAFTRGAVEILLIFATLGLGLAAPWILVAAVPHLAQMLPRPGRWMIWLKAVLGAVLLATAIWLISVLDLQIGRVASLTMGFLLAVILLVLALARALPLRWRAAAPIAVLLIAALQISVSLGAAVTATSPDQARAGSTGKWRTFAEKEIAGLVAAGNIVFVDVTADWCLTCQANKALVLESPHIRARLEAPKVVAMQADWTRPDATIAAYLASFGRYGIPFNVVYGPGAPDGVTLPEILTKDAVLQALAKAGG
jgi:suppressor for copper-sensitivity B